MPAGAMQSGNESNHTLDGLTVRGGLNVLGSLVVGGAAVRPLLFGALDTFAVSTKNHATSTYSARGVDPVAGAVYISDTTNGFLRISEDWGTTYSGGKGYPSNTVTATGAYKVVRFGTKIFALTVDSVSGLAKVSSATPTTGNTAITWATALTHSTGVTSALSCTLNAGSRYIYSGEYGAAAAGPSIYRSLDGVTWETCYGPDPVIPNHIHCVIEDPYNPGHIYASTGDGGGRTILRSTSYGDVGSWSILVAASEWQAVQLSFDANWVWCAHDSHRMTVSVIDRVTGTPYCAGATWHYNIAVPGAAASTDRFYQNAYYGAVEPRTGIYYCFANDTSVPGNTAGMFYVSSAGEDVRLLEEAIGGREPFFGGGFVWSAGWHRKLLG